MTKVDFIYRRNIPVAKSVEKIIIQKSNMSNQSRIIAFILLAFLVGTLFGTAQSWVYLAASNNVKGWNPFITPTPTPIKKIKVVPTATPTPTLIPTPTDEPTAIPAPVIRRVFIAPTPTTAPVYNYVSPEGGLN